MPRLNTSKHVKARTRQLLERLLSYANYELPDSEQFDDRLTVRWKNENTASPELVVETELRVLIELAFSQSETPRLKDQLRNDLRVLEEFLEILEDNRARTQGAKNWRFTLKLWGKSTESNLSAFESFWDERKRQRSKRRGNVIVPATPPTGDDPAGDDDPGGSTTTGSSPATPSPTADIPGSSGTPPKGGGPQASLSIHPTPVAERPHLRSNLLMQHGASAYNDSGYLTQLLELLSFDTSSHLVTIEGQGGVGKTTLAVEAARLCQLASENPAGLPSVPKFEAIIFTSAQTQHFNGPDLSPRLGHQRNLQDIFRTILRTLDRLGSIPPDFHDQLYYVRDCLGAQKTLLIVDNLETLEDKEYVLSFLHEIPHTVKVVVTSRVRLGMGDTISLNPLSQSESINLIRRQAEAQSLSLTQKQIEQVHKLTGGLPLAIIYSLGLVAAFGINPSHLQSTDLSAPTGDLARHCFNTAVERLRHQPAYHLLLAFACFRRPAQPEALAHIAHGNAYLREDRRPFNELYRLSLIERQQERYTMHSLTREYATAELRANSRFEEEARDRWVEWYLEFLAVHGEENWYDWHPASPVDAEWENIREVVEWCREQNSYQDFLDLWQHLKGYTQTYGHWNERLVWMKWLMDEAEKHQNWPVMADAMYHYARTLRFFDQPDSRVEAIEVANRIWEISATDNWQLLTDVALLLVTLHTNEEEYDIALRWLKKSKTLYERSTGSTKERRQQWITIPYYEAEIVLKMGRRQEAQGLYSCALERSETVGLKRSAAYIRGELGALKMLDGDLDAAEELLVAVLPLAKEHRDQRCLAYAYSHLAEVYKRKDAEAEAKNFANLAIDQFQILGMPEQSEALRRKYL